MKTYKVFISQVNRQMLEITAENAEDAAQKGYQRWQEEFAKSYVEAVEEK